MINSNRIVSRITWTVNGLNTPIKKYRYSIGLKIKSTTHLPGGYKKRALNTKTELG